MMTPHHFRESIQGLGHRPDPIFTPIGDIFSSIIHSKEGAKFLLSTFVTLGRKLGKCLIYKWLKGAYSQPLQMKI